MRRNDDQPVMNPARKPRLAATYAAGVVVGCDVLNSSSGRPRTPEEIADRRLKRVLSQGAIAAGMYCTRNKADEESVRQEAAGFREDPRIQRLISELNLKDAQATPDYLVAAGEAIQPCMPFRAVLQSKET